MDASELKGLVGIKTVTTISLGVAPTKRSHDYPRTLEPAVEPAIVPPQCLALRLTQFGLAFLHKLGQITDLDLGGCVNASQYSTIIFIQGLPQIAKLNLSGIKLSDDGISGIAQLLRLSDLTLDNCTYLKGEGLGHLRKLPIQRLSLRGCTGLKDAAVVQLAKFMGSLQILILAGCTGLTAAALAPLRGGGPPLTNLDLSQVSDLADSSLRCLKGKPLRRLVLDGCTKLTDDGLSKLRKMPLADLSFAHCGKVTGSSLEVRYLLGQKILNI